MQIRHSLPFLATCLLACGAEAPDQGSSLDDSAFDHEAGRRSVTHYNHWAPASAGGMNQSIGGGNYYPNCADWNLWDMAPWEASAYGFHSYRTKDATTTHDTSGDRQYSGAHWSVCDGYGGANCSVASRMGMLINNQSWWNSQDLWGSVAGWNGSVYANTSSRSHSVGRCTGAFVLTFDADAAYTRGEYWVSATHEANITDQFACRSAHPDSVPWTGLDLYVRECPSAGGACRDRIGGSSSKIGGTWNYSWCDTSSRVYYKPTLGWKVAYLNAVVSAGVGHVPSAAKIYVERWY